MREQLFPIPQGKLISEKISKRIAVSMWARKRKGQPIVAEIANNSQENPRNERELFYKTSKEKVKLLHLPTGESPLAKKGSCK